MQVDDTSKFKEGERVRIYVNEAPGAAERPKAGWQPWVPLACLVFEQS